MKPRVLNCVLFSAAIGLTAAALRISEDRDLIDVDLNTWNCRDRAEGSARVPDGAERNRLKNRSAPAAMPTEVKTFDTAGFLRYVGAFDAQSKERRRKEITPGQKPQLDALEQQIVTLTGYLGYAYAGPGETTNCGSIDIHDWHLEIFDKPPEHPPQPGDVTPIVCEITPRFQHALFSENIRVQKLAAFFRRPDLGYEATGHPAVKVRITGYLLWDDEHNGEKDAGLAVRTAPPNAYHNPWRATAWEIHPIIKIEPLDGNATAPAVAAASPPATTAATPGPSLTSPVPAPPPVTLTILQPVKIRIPYGETVIPRGAHLRVISRDNENAIIEYLGQSYTVPLSSTDLK